MFATATQIDPALALAIGDAASCDWQDGPTTPPCGARAVWVARLSCGCVHFCCAPHKPAAQADIAAARRAELVALLLYGLASVYVCITCSRPLDLTIVWEPI